MCAFSRPIGTGDFDIYDSLISFAILLEKLNNFSEVLRKFAVTRYILQYFNHQ